MDLRITRFIDRHVGVPACYIIGLISSKARKKKLENRKSAVKKILLIKFWGLGNIILATPAIQAIRQKYPEAQIDFLTLSDNRSLLESLTEINNIIDIKLTGIIRFIKDFFILIISVRKSRYDIIVDFEPFARSSAILTFLSSTKTSVGFETPAQGRGALYSNPVPYNNNQHIVKTFYDLATKAGCPAEDTDNLVLSRLEPKNKNECAYVDKILNGFNAKNGRIVGIHVGTGPNATTRRWPVENYCKLVEALVQNYQAKIVFTGGKAERNAINEILSKLGDLSKHCIDLCTKLTIPQLALLMNNMALFISSDTGPLHLAAAQGTKTISFYGPNTPKIYGPWGSKKNNIVIYKQLKCSPCMTNYNDKLSRCIFNEPYCITTITPSEVIEQIRLNQLF